jgi:hypothetical protein
VINWQRTLSYETFKISGGQCVWTEGIEYAVGNDVKVGLRLGRRRLAFTLDGAVLQEKGPILVISSPLRTCVLANTYTDRTTRIGTVLTARVMCT